MPPDLGTCLLQQKLAMVQLCIVRRRQAREQRASVGVAPASPTLAHMRAPIGKAPVFAVFILTDSPCRRCLRLCDQN